MTVPRELRYHRDVLGVDETRVLLAVVACQQERGRSTVRDVCERAGYRSTASVHAALVRLRDAGLVTWRDGKMGTLRPAVRPVGFAVQPAARS